MLKNISKVIEIMIIIFIFLVITYRNYFHNQDNFTVVEDNVDKIILIQDNSLLSKINKKKEVVDDVWGCSEFGKKMKLC